MRRGARKGYDPMLDGGSAATAPAPPFTPVDIADCFGWWRADLGVVGAPVDSWADQVNGYSMAQATANKKPTVTASTAELNGQPSLTFDGSNDVLIFTGLNSVFTALSTVWTAFVIGVARQTSGNGSVYWTGQNTAGLRPGAQLQIRTTGGIVRHTIVNGSTTIASLDTAVTLPVAYRFISRGDTAETPDLDIDVNGAAQTTNFTGAVGGSPNNPLAFGDTTNTPAQPYRGDLAEVAFYSRFLTGAEVAQLEAYALDRYGL